MRCLQYCPPIAALLQWGSVDILKRELSEPLPAWELPPACSQSQTCADRSDSVVREQHSARAQKSAPLPGSENQSKGRLPVTQDSVALTFMAPGRSGYLETLSAWMVSVNAGHGDE